MLLWVCPSPQSAGVSLGRVPFMHTVKGALLSSFLSRYLSPSPAPRGPFASSSGQKDGLSLGVLTASVVATHFCVTWGSRRIKEQEKGENRITRFSPMLFRPLRPERCGFSGGCTYLGCCRASQQLGRPSGQGWGRRMGGGGVSLHTNTSQQPLSWAPGRKDKVSLEVFAALSPLAMAYMC